MEIVINEKFRSLIPPLSDQEKQQLEENIVKDGCRDPLVIWRRGSVATLIDGHNRHEICTRRGVKYKTVEVAFSSDEDAEDWIDANQLGRRNLTPDAASLLRGRRYNRAKKKQGGRSDRDVSGGQNVHPKTAETLAKQHGVDERTIRRDGKFADAVEKLKPVIPDIDKQVVSGNKAKSAVVQAAELWEKSPEKAQAALNKECTVNQIKRELKRESLITEAKALPKGVYRVIYADPPWSYNDKCDGGSVQSGGAERHYPSLSIDELCRLPVCDMAADNAVLFIWVTSPLLEDVFTVIRAWGFKYKSSFIWDKIRHNMGHYNSVRHELLLIATRGSCTPDTPTLFDSVQSIERSDKHSEKPQDFRKLIDTLYTAGNRVEMFARTAAKGWDKWGNEA